MGPLLGGSHAQVARYGRSGVGPHGYVGDWSIGRLPVLLLGSVLAGGVDVALPAVKPMCSTGRATKLISTVPAGGGRRRGLLVNPERVRRARLDAGFSLADVVAGAGITRSALHQVEAGKTRPSLHTLRAVAEKTGKTLDYFLEPGQEELLREEESRAPGPDLQILEMAIAQERFDVAKTEANRLLKFATQASWRARVSLLLAESYIRTAEVEPALSLLADASKVFTDANDSWMVVECLDWQAAAEHLLEDPAALATASRALRLAKSLSPVPDRTLVRIYGRIGSICVSQHKWREAIEAYEHAIRTGAGLLDMSRLAKMHNDLSIAYRRLGQLTNAERHARKSIAIHELLEDRLSIGRAETNLGLVLIRQRELDAAASHLRRALDLFVEAGQTRGRAHILLAQAEMFRERKDFDSGRIAAEEAAELARELGERATVAESSQVLATISAAEHDYESAGRMFDDSIAILQELDLRDRLTTVHAAYASMLEAKGDTVAALKHWRLAVSATHPEAAAIILSGTPLVRGETA